MGFFIEWFQIQKEFTSLFEEMSLQQLEKCFCLSARERDGDKIVIVGNNQWVENDQFWLNYLTVWSHLRKQRDS